METTPKETHSPLVIRPAITALIAEAQLNQTQININRVCDMDPKPNHLEATALIPYLDDISLAGRIRVTLANAPNWPLFTPGFVANALCAEEALRLEGMVPQLARYSNMDLSADVFAILDGMVTPVPTFTPYPQPADRGIAGSYVEALWFLGREASTRLAARTVKTKTVA